jgi:hypothetical protein
LNRKLDQFAELFSREVAWSGNERFGVAGIYNLNIETQNRCPPHIDSRSPRWRSGYSPTVNADNALNYLNDVLGAVSYFE